MDNATIQVSLQPERVERKKILKLNKTRKNNEQRREPKGVQVCADWSSSAHNTKPLTAKSVQSTKKKHSLAVPHRAIGYLSAMSLVLWKPLHLMQQHQHFVLHRTLQPRFHNLWISRIKSHGSTKRKHTKSPNSHPKLDRTTQQQQQQAQGTSPLLSQYHQQQMVQQEYQCHSSLSDILKANVFTRWRTWKGWTRTTTATCTGLHVASVHLPLYHWLTSSTAGQTEHKGDEFILDIEAVQESAYKCVASHLFLKALKESGICGLL